MDNQPRGRPAELPARCLKTAPLAGHSKPLGSPPGLPSQPPPGLTVVHQTQAVTQAVVGQVQAMLARFEEFFEWRLAQVEAKAPRERSRLPLREFSPKERRINEFSSQEDSAVVKVASVSTRFLQGRCRRIATLFLRRTVMMTF